jgi:hypothetical protein
MVTLLRYFFALVFLTVLMCLPACRDEHAADLPTVFELEPEFTVDLFEQRDPLDGTARFGLWVESMADCTCSGCAVVAETAVQGNDISVHLLGIQEPMPCVGQPAPARTFVSIGQLPDGEYRFSLSLRSAVTNTGSLSVAEGRYTLTMPAPQGIVFQNYVLEKMPADMLWGYALTPDEASVLAAQNWISDLKSITTDGGLAPGFYSYFTVSGNGAVFLHKSLAPQGASQVFVRKLNVPTADLTNLLQTYRANALEVKCLTTRGEF